MRIVAFGCSITYGQSMEDNHPENIVPSQYAWPQQLANIVGTEAINKGQMGAGCKEILNIILDFEFKPSDVVVIAWSYPERWSIISEDNNVKQIGPWMWENYKKPLLNKVTATANVYYEYIWNEYDSFLDQRRNIKFAKLYLDSIGIKSYHTTIIDEEYQNKKWFDISLLDIGIRNYIKSNTRALDGLHPGQEAHHKIANEFWNKTNGLKI